MSQDTGQVWNSPGTGSAIPVRLWKLPVRSSLACLLAAFAGCVSGPPPLPDIPDIVIPEPEPLPLPPPAVAEEAPPAPAPTVPQAEPAPPFRLKAAIVLSDRSPAYENVATELGRLLEQPPIYNIADRSQSAGDAFADIASSGAAVVIAIGFPAVSAAAQLATVPVVYCQVFNLQSADSASVPVKGVASIPPLALQIKEWKKLDPELRSVGAILGEGHEKLIAEAARATGEHDIELHYRVAGSDRETLYQFQRMAPHIDGFWLFPDNRILSVAVLEQLVNVAARHRVRIAVFNDALLEMGASLSSSAVAADIAATVVSVAVQIAKNPDASVPDLTPLNNLEVRQNPAGDRRTDSFTVGESKAGGASKGSL